jgi:UDP-3-O-[3-hydroxymyristoyl] glucosamine N-acyltransferase
MVIMINNGLLKKVLDIDVQEFSVSSLGVADSSISNEVITFITDEKYICVLNQNKNIKAVFIENKLSSLIRSDVLAIVTDDPVWCFFTLLSYLAENRQRDKTVISKTATVHSSAVISDEGVIIGDNVKIEPNVTIYPDVIIEDAALIRAGAVIGVDGFEHKRTSKGIVSVAHDGKVIIKRNAEIGVNNNIVKGFSYRDTIVGENTKLDGLVHYAHGVQSGSGCMITASAMFAGHVTLGNNVWVGPNSSISNRLNIGDGAFITIGSVVVKDVAAGEKVTGNFAIPHVKFINNLKKSLK